MSFTDGMLSCSEGLYGFSKPEGGGWGVEVMRERDEFQVSSVSTGW